MAEQQPEKLVETWPLPYAATLGSSIRRQGLFLEIRARLAPSVRRSLKVGSGILELCMSPKDSEQFLAARAVIGDALDGIETLAILPREIEDILQISSTERHRWLKDGRLHSAGTRTVKLRGRARQVTFHIFDPRLVEDLLDRDRVTEWREADLARAAENRRRAKWKAQLSRVVKPGTGGSLAAGGAGTRTSSKLVGWDEFEREGLLRQGPNRVRFSER